MIGVLHELLDKIGDEDIIIDVIPASEEHHPAAVSALLVLIKIVGHNDVYTVPVDCYDFSNNVSRKQVELFFSELTCDVYCFSKKKILHLVNIDGLLDLSLKMFLMTGEIIDECDYETAAHRFFKNKYKTHVELNKIIPHTNHISKFLDVCKDVESYVNKFNEDSYKRINEDVIETLQTIEKSGICVDIDVFTDHFPDKGHLVSNKTVYTEYNILTSTGRPSNRFGGINYSALNKENKCRSSFISRYGDDGMLVMFDYSAYHPHIIARLINYEFPAETNVYKYLGQYYFKTENLSEDQVKRSKTLTFQQLYGSISSEYKDIPYFTKIIEYMNHRWNHFNEHGYVETPIFKRQISPSHLKDATPSKLFNYILQASETEYSMEILVELNRYLEKKYTKCVLYTYDSMLFDVHKEDGKNTILDVKKLMESTGFPTKCYVGKNYDDMQVINL
jgi:DNA polymerase I-like protein with 3'-5' exonuclease and polymerase domains